MRGSQTIAWFPVRRIRVRARGRLNNFTTVLVVGLGLLFLRPHRLGPSAATTTIMFAQADATVATVVLRALSPAIVLLSTLALFATRHPNPSSPSPITPVVVASYVPRRALILCLLSLSALTYFLDGLVFVAFAIIDKTWPSNTGLEFNTIVGLAAFAGLAALGAWKDVNGINVWSLKRVKFAVFSALVLDAALVILLGNQVSGKCEVSSQNSSF